MFVLASLLAAVVVAWRTRDLRAAQFVMVPGVLALFLAGRRGIT